MEVGAFTVFLYMIKAREWLWELVEAVTGARLTISYGRIGGVKADLPEGFAERTRRTLHEVRKVLLECDALLTRNRIFVDRMQDTGVISQEEAVNYGITGPFLRSTGLALDVRKAQPYFVYDRMRFDVPTGAHGDNYDRYLVRMEEMEQSMRIIEQALDQIPPGPINVDAEGTVLSAEAMVDEAKMGRVAGFQQAHVVVEPTLEGSTREFHDTVNALEKRAVLPAKEDTYGNIEGLMNHFKLVMTGHGLRPPAGEYYSAVEGANGELGFYVVSDGSERPYRVRVRPPCFTIMSALPRLLVGDLLADIIPTFGSVNMIGGELDR
jgi:NADH-quinone oxidoreductase subunit D